MPLQTQTADWLIERDGFAFIWKPGGMTIAGGLSEDGGLDDVAEIMTTRTNGVRDVETQWWLSYFSKGLRSSISTFSQWL